MNRIFPRVRPVSIAPRMNLRPLLRHGQRNRQDAEALLRDLAYMLHLTRRVKAELLAEYDPLETANH